MEIILVTNENYVKKESDRSKQPYERLLEVHDEINSSQQNSNQNDPDIKSPSLFPSFFYHFHLILPAFLKDVFLLDVWAFARLKNGQIYLPCCAVYAQKINPKEDRCED